MFRLKKSSSGVSKNHKINYNMPVHIWDPDGSQCLLGFAYNVIPTYYCIYVYIGGGVCAISWGRCSLGSWLCQSWFFYSSCFSVSGGWVGGLSTCNLFLLLLCILFYFCKYKVQSKKICKCCMHRLEIKTVPPDDFLA